MLDGLSRTQALGAYPRLCFLITPKAPKGVQRTNNAGTVSLSDMNFEWAWS